MRINNNLMAMNTHRQLGVSNNSGAKSMEKLSSGFRINRAGDDAAGLSISEKMRGQIRGLTQASRNAQDGISMIQTAEGALNETHAILQRMRELAVQSSTDTNVNELDREAIDNEYNKLKEEIDRIGNTTEFNTQKLLQGDGKANLNASNLKDVTGKLGATTATEGKDAYKVQAKDVTTIAGTVTAIAENDTLKWTINGEDLTVTFKANAAANGDAGAAYDVTANTANINKAGAAGTAKYAAGDTAAVAKDTAAALQAMIDKNDTLKGAYTAKAVGSEVVIEAVKDGRFDGAAGSVSKVTASLTTATATNKPADTVAGKDVAAVAAKKEINFDTLVDTTGADAAAKLAKTLENVKDLVGTGMTINGQQVEFYNANDGAYKGDAIGINISDALLGATDKEVVEGLVKAIETQVKESVDGVTLTQKDTITNATVLVITAEPGKAGNNIEVSDGGVQEDFKATLQIGANEGQTMEVTMRDMRAKALGINDVSLANKDDASSAITTINDAINKVSNQRSELGAFQNRLEHTIKNLDNSAENLQAAEARIRDVDMAKEMMEQTKQNILSQAATAMLAQANQAPQGVLQLLR